MVINMKKSNKITEEINSGNHNIKIYKPVAA